VVIDTCNYHPQRDGQIPELDSGALTSSELIQRHLPESAVVKAFNNIYYRHLASLARPSGAADRSYLPIAGDDAAAKVAVTDFLDSIGYGAIDAGPLAEGWRQQPGTPVYGAPYGSFQDTKGSPRAPARYVRRWRPPSAKPARNAGRRSGCQSRGAGPSAASPGRVGGDRLMAGR
jgi:hypothetical protein